eukprot:TRINITY_DN4046_c4_g1_i1.p1 TRINITY_DN4046_c4_g1~~TRINITY_DN4046_c4_g1_i1.p1  ORF type:complete len:338 (+),score=63.47 TRINITY_DN4046_c4_g1_i1:86-1015(+)
MGDTIGKPVTEKASVENENELLMVGASEMQGWRKGMEDAHSVVLELKGSNKGGCGFFGVFDGHSGKGAARYAAKHLHGKIAETKEFEEGNWEPSVRKGFLAFDTLLEETVTEDDGSGCTAVTCLITPDGFFVVGNAGDSRCLLCRGGRPHPLSFDHKPNNEIEAQRIAAAGGHVTGGRVNGSLALSRALGDFEYKQNPDLPQEKQVVTANPDVTLTPVQADDEFVVLACDGIWDVMTNEEVIDFVRRRLQTGMKPAKICEDVCDRCLAPQAPGYGCDNMTVLIVVLTDELKNQIGLRLNTQRDVADTAE